MSNIFEHELVKVLMGNLGLVPMSNFGGNIGVAHKDFAIGKTIDLQYDDNTAQQNRVYCAQTSLEALKTCCVSFDDYICLILSFRDKSIYGLKFDYSGELNNLPDFLSKSKEWRATSRFERVMVFAEVEKIATSTLAWKPLKSEDLFEYLVEFVDFCQ